MQPNEPVVCDCCDPDTPRKLATPPTVIGLIRGWRCRMCNEHQGQPLKMARGPQRYGPMTRPPVVTNRGVIGRRMGDHSPNDFSSTRGTQTMAR
jgi:hypothetical protein